MEPFKIKANERCFFTGRTGSGKSTLADRIIRSLGYRTVVIDPKHLWEFPGYQLVTQYSPDPKLIRQLFRPVDKERDDWRDSEIFLESVWNQPVKNTVVYVDEVASLSTPFKTLPILEDFVRLGRGAGFGTWSGTQRPSGLPQVFLTEAEHWFVFDLRRMADRVKVAGFLGDAAEDRPDGEYSFYYANPKMPDALLVRQER